MQSAAVTNYWKQCICGLRWFFDGEKSPGIASSERARLHVIQLTAYRRFPLVAFQLLRDRQKLVCTWSVPECPMFWLRCGSMVRARNTPRKNSPSAINLSDFVAPRFDFFSKGLAMVTRSASGSQIQPCPPGWVEAIS